MQYQPMGKVYYQIKQYLFSYSWMEQLFFLRRRCKCCDAVVEKYKQKIHKILISLTIHINHSKSYELWIFQRKNQKSLMKMSF